MPTAPLFTDDLLDPISAEQPAGTDLRWTPDWDRIKEARRADDDFASGKWAKRERKTADWPLVQELATAMLRDRSKDLQLAMWLTEAQMKLHGFAGLRDGFRITRELMARYWDQGLYPAIEDGPEDRAAPFEWLNNKLADAIKAIPITARDDSGQNYTFIDLQDARRTGSEASCRNSDGEFDPKKKQEYDQALAEGRISMEMFDRAVRETRRGRYEELSADFEQTYAEFKSLEKLIDEKFADVAPNLAACRAVLSEIKQASDDILRNKRNAEPDALVPANAAEPSSSAQDERPAVVMRFPISLPYSGAAPVAMEGSWQEAEMLIHSGQVEKGLAQMTRLAAGETSGRSRFHRKLLLAEVCLASQRERLARLILEELAEQIEKFQLEFWESSELISSVWSRLYHLYRRAGESSDLERAGKLYERLCRLDPWQALGCGEG